MSSGNRSWAIAAAIALTVACGGDDNADMSSPQLDTLRCEAGQVRACPCPGQGMGTQTCSPLGDSFGPCTGCPPAEGAAGQSAGTAGTGAAGMGPMSAGSSGSPGEAGAGALPDAGAADASVDEPADDDKEPSQTAGAVPGISCGVGLPSLCAIENEKCCARDLSVDTCIADDAACTCEIGGCQVMEVRCDGPEDCPDGQVCCGTLAGAAAYQDFSCASQCQATGNQRVACHEGETECPANLVCSNSQLLTNIQVCIDPATIQQ